MQRYVDAILRRIRLFSKVRATQGYRAAFSLVMLSLRHRLGLVATKKPMVSIEQIPELVALRQNLGQCQDSIRQLTALLAEARSGGRSPLLVGPKISVIMAVYNRVDIVAAAIGSVLAQAGADFELVVADDGSTDGLNSETVPALSDPRVRLIRLPHCGVCVARNAAVAASQGSVIVYLDSDNRMYPGYLQAVAAAYAAQPSAECGHAAMLWDDQDRNVHLRHDAFSWNDLYNATINIDLNCFSHRKSVWDRRGGFDENLTKHSDYDLALRYLREAPPMRISAVAAWYYSGNAFSRISISVDSARDVAVIRAKHRRPLGRKPRVLIFCDDYPQISESYVDTEISYMLRQGFEIEVCSRVAAGSPGIAQVPTQIGTVQRMIESFQPDLIHAHWLTIATRAAESAQRAGLPMTVRSHGFDYSHETFKQCAQQKSVKYIYLFPHFVAGLPPHEKAVPVTSAFDSKRFYPRARRNEKMVLRAGACLETKDIPLFFDVAARCPEFKFVLALSKITSLPDLPEKFVALNASLGNPVDLRFDVQYDEMAALTGDAGIYLHTFGFIQPFGMPVSIAESLACGALVLARDCPEAREYAGPQALYYRDVGEAVKHIRATLAWREADWQARSGQAVAFAQRYNADTALARIADDWREIVESAALRGPTPGAM